MTGIEAYIVFIQTKDGPRAVFGSVRKKDCEAFLPDDMPAEERERAIQLVPILGLLFKAESYDQFQHTASDVMERFTRSGFGKRGEANTFWAMTMAALDELDQLRRDVPILKKMIRAQPLIEQLEAAEPAPSYAPTATPKTSDDVCPACQVSYYDKTPECAACHDNKYILVHADGPPCQGSPIGPDGCVECGIHPDTQSTEFWRRSLVKK